MVVTMLTRLDVAVDTVADVGEAVTGDGDEDVEYRKAEYGGSD